MRRGLISASASLALTFVLVATASTQVLRVDNFDDSTGDVIGTNGWFGTAGQFTKIASTNPAPTSGANVLRSITLNQTVGNFIGPLWAARTAGKNILVAEIDFRSDSQDSTQRSLNFGISNDSADVLASIGYSTTGNVLFTANSSSDFTAGPFVPRDTWVRLGIRLDTTSGGIQFFRDGVQIASSTVINPLTINSIFINSVTIFGGNPRGAYFDTMRVEAVPEPATMAAMLVGVAALRRRRR
jgi:hypothetical protein